MSNRNTLLYLTDIIESIDAINSYLKDVDYHHKPSVYKNHPLPR